MEFLDIDFKAVVVLIVFAGVIVVGVMIKHRLWVHKVMACRHIWKRERITRHGYVEYCRKCRVRKDSFHA